MERIIFILSLSLGSVVFGYLIRRFILDRYISSGERLNKFSKELKFFAIFILNPIPVISSFWTVSLENTSLFILPFLGVLLIFIGGSSALIINRIFRIPPKQAASVFTSGMFSNVLTFGGLTAYMFFGIEGYVLLQLFNMLITTINFLIGYPMSEQISLGRPLHFSLSSGILKNRPYLLIPFISLTIGFILNMLGIPRPDFLPRITAVLIPLITGCLGFSIGITLYVSRIGKYYRELILISLIKFVISPLVMASIGILFGLHNFMDGIPFKIIIIASSMPVAFNALIPPSIYDFDLDLANSAWIVTTFAFIIVLPTLYFLLRL